MYKFYILFEGSWQKSIKQKRAENIDQHFQSIKATNYTTSGLYIFYLSFYMTSDYK